MQSPLIENVFYVASIHEYFYSRFSAVKSFQVDTHGVSQDTSRSKEAFAIDHPTLVLLLIIKVCVKVNRSHSHRLGAKCKLLTDVIGERLTIGSRQ